MISVRRLARRVLKRHQVAPVILMYHRIATMTWDPWRLAVTPKSFREQLAYLKRNRTVLRLSDFVTAHRDGRLPDDAAAITFDDGYRDQSTRRYLRRRAKRIRIEDSQQKGSSICSFSSSPL